MTTWYLRRLLAMSPAEIVARVSRSARHRLDDLSLPLEVRP
jgi:hypothetical protein